MMKIETKKLNQARIVAQYKVRWINQIPNLEAKRSYREIVKNDLEFNDFFIDEVFAKEFDKKERAIYAQNRNIRNIKMRGVDNDVISSSFFTKRINTPEFRNEIYKYLMNEENADKKNYQKAFSVFEHFSKDVLDRERFQSMVKLTKSFEENVEFQDIKDLNFGFLGGSTISSLKDYDLKRRSVDIDITLVDENISQNKMDKRLSLFLNKLKKDENIIVPDNEWNSRSNRQMYLKIIYKYESEIPKVLLDKIEEREEAHFDISSLLYNKKYYENSLLKEGFYEGNNNLLTRKIEINTLDKVFVAAELKDKKFIKDPYIVRHFSDINILMANKEVVSKIKGLDMKEFLIDTKLPLKRALKVVDGSFYEKLSDNKKLEKGWKDLQDDHMKIDNPNKEVSWEETLKRTDELVEDIVQRKEVKEYIQEKSKAQRTREGKEIEM